MKIKFLFSFTAIIALALTAFSQASVGTGGNIPPSFVPQLLPLPSLTLSAGTAGTIGNVTNFYSGFVGVTGYNTNVVGASYSPALGGFTTPSTNVITNTAAIFPSIYIPRDSVVQLEYRGIESGTGTTNTVFTFAPSVSGRPGMGSTSGQWQWTVSVNQGTAPTVATYAFTNTFGSLFLISQTWNGTNTANGTLTNLDGGIYYGLEPLNH